MDPFAPGIAKTGQAMEVEDQMEQEGKKNYLKSYRAKVFISRAELARKAGISEETIDRIERGKSCRLETKRKIIQALGLELSDAGKIFGEESFNLQAKGDIVESGESEQ
ncbi:MAG: family transcriptional regulator [Deltaproteobacteria bacterium]|nr:family transcriptional regulator [Deltaproteobacteria bacterium]